MAYTKKYSIFISSTYEDLKEERQAVMGVALENNIIPIGMEQFHAAPASQWDVITKMIDECDGYLLVIGGRYGSIDETEGFSYTEKEYRYAKIKKIPVCVLIRQSNFLTGDKMDSGKKYSLLEKFKTMVMNDGNTVDFFGNVDDLKYKTAQAMKNFIAYFPEDAGWVRCSDMQSNNPNDVSKEKVDLEKHFRVEDGTLIIGDKEKNAFKKIYNDLYPELIAFRESLKVANVSRLCEATEKIQDYIQSLYYEAERCRYSNKEDANKAAEIVKQWNLFSHEYNAFVDSQDRMSDEAQEKAQRAETLFLVLVDKVVQNINS